MRKNKKMKKANKGQGLELLENRTMMTTVTVHPGDNIVSAANSAGSGATVQFAPGTYNLGTTSLPADRHYVGNGATLSGSGQIKIDDGSSTEVTGLTFNGLEFVTNNANGLNVHDNTFQNISSDAIFVAGNTNSHFDHNTFENISGNGIYGYPGTTNTYDYNRMDNVGEGIHLSQTGLDNTDVSYNVITNSHRHGIELQQAANNLTVTHNWIQAADMAISCATGGVGSAGTNAGENITIADNVADGRAVKVFGAGIEIMGDHNINIDDNYLVGFSNGGWAILNGTGGARGEGLNTSGNIISAGHAYGDGDSTPWSVPPRHSNDTIYSWGASNTPGLPSIPTYNGAGVRSGTITNGAGGTPGGTVTAPPPTPTTPTTPTIPTTPTSSTATPATFAATSPSSGQINLSWKPQSNKATYILERKTTHGNDGYVTIATLATGATSYKDTNSIQGTWEYDYRLTAVQGGVKSVGAGLTVQAKASSTPAVGESVHAPTVATAPTNFTTAAQSSSEIVLSWKDNNSGAATYVLQRKSTRGSDPYVTIATLPAGTTSYIDTTNVQATWEYDYTLTAVIGTSQSSAIYAHGEALDVGATAPTPVTGAGGNWTDSDLGNDATAGSSLLAKGTYRVSSGTANDSTGTSHFVYETTSGDTSIVARVTDSSSISNFGSAGVSMRSGTDAGSTSISLGINSSGDVTLVTADGTGATSDFDAGPGSAGSRWLKLVRSDGAVTGYYSNDGSSWQRVGSVTSSLPDSLNVGLTVSGQADGTEGVAWFRNVAIRSGATASAVKQPAQAADRIVKRAKVAKTETHSETHSETHGKSHGATHSAAKTAANGLTAKIYANANLTGKSFNRVDADVSFAWGNATPDSSVTSAPYSVQWTGAVEATTTDTYTFTVHSDSGVKLWVNDKLVVKDWTKTSTGDDSGTVKLVAGRHYDIKLDYTEPTATDDSAISLLWSNSAHGIQVIPQSNLLASAA